MDLGIQDLVTRAEEQVGVLFDKHHVPADHGLDHCRQVRQHAELVLEVDFPDLPLEVKSAVLLAAILHDVDDRKLFPKNQDHQHARMILTRLGQVDRVDLVLEIIATVSTKENGQSVNPAVPEWYYVVRDCDRLEAIGESGVRRCCQFAARIQLPIFTPETPLPTSEAELAAALVPERFAEYQRTGKSASLVDHFLHKLFWLRPSVKQSIYLANQFANRQLHMQKVFLDLCRQQSFMLFEDDLTDPSM